MRKIIIFFYLLITPLRAESVFPLDPAARWENFTGGENLTENQGEK